MYLGVSIMENKYYYRNIGSALACRIACDSRIDLESIGKEFIELNFNPDVIEDQLSLFPREITYGLYNKQIVNWFFNSEYINDFTAMYGLSIITDNVRLNYSLYRNCDRAMYSRDGRLMPFANHSLSISNLPSFCRYFKQFIHIDSFVSINPGIGKSDLQCIIGHEFKGHNICLTAGFLYSGDLDYWLYAEDSNQLMDLVDYYMSFGFKNINSWCEGNDTSVAMMLLNDHSTILRGSDGSKAFWNRQLSDMNIF